MAPFDFNVALEVCGVVLPAAAVLLAVFRQSKTIAALAQLGAVQDRDAKRADIARKAIQVDKNWFQLGVLNGFVSAYILGAFPCAYFLFYIPKALVLIFLRFVTFYKKKQHFLLWDFCYWANFMAIFYCLGWPRSPWLFRVIFMCANGPLAWSVLAFNHAMIFHSYAHITSVVIHTSPLMLAYGLRWYGYPQYDEKLFNGDATQTTEPYMANRFVVCDEDFETTHECFTGGNFQLVREALTGFYLWWMILYYIWIFVALGSYVEKKGYQTLWDRILMMKPVGPMLKGMLERFPKLIVQGVYMLIHLLFSVCTMLVASVLWYNQFAHFFFLGAIIISTVKNAGLFYFEMFEGHYQDAMSRKGDDQLHKKIRAASPGLAEISQPMGCS